MKAATRFAILAALLVVIPALVVGVILYRNGQAMLLDQARARLAFAMQQAEKDLGDAVGDARAKVAFLTDTPPLAVLPRLKDCRQRETWRGQGPANGLETAAGANLHRPGAHQPRHIAGPADRRSR